MKLEAQLSNVNPDRAVLQGPVVGRFMEKCVADVLLGQLVGLPVNGLLRDEMQQILSLVLF